MNTKNTKTAAKQAAEGRKQTAAKRAPHEPTEQAEAAFMKRMKAEAEKAAAEQAAKQAEEMKGEETMKNTKKTAEQTAPKAEEGRAVKTVEQIKSLFEAARNGATKEDRMKAAEAAAEAVEAFNAAALMNAAARCSFLQAAEAYRPNAPKKAEAAKKGVDYTRRAEPVQYIHIDEEGNAAARLMNLVTFARVAFMKTANAEQVKAFEAALKAVEAFQKAFIEREDNEGVKAAANALNGLVKACGLDKFTTMQSGFGFTVKKSFIRAAAVRVKGRRGVYLSEAAAREEAMNRLLNASAERRAKAEAAVKKAEENAVKVIFTIIAEAAAAAVVGVEEAALKTAEDVKTEQAARERREAERAAKREEREAKTAEQAKKAVEKKRAALKKAAEELKAAEEREAALKAAEEKKTAVA